MQQLKSRANVEKIVAGLKKGDKLPPLLVRKYKDGYQVLDGHHRFWAYKLLGIKSIPAQVVPDSDIEEISKPSVAEGKQPGKSVTDAIQKVLPIAQEIWFHGSRATGKHRRNSDTDILVVVPVDLVGDQYLGVVRTLQKLSSIFDNYDIQPTKSGTNIHRIAQEEGQLLWSNKQDMAENMDHRQDGGAVEELRTALLVKRDQLQAATDDQVYDIIDRIMTRIARSHSISGQKLHDMWVDRYKQIPDTWIMNEDIPQPGASSGAPTQFAPGTEIKTRPMTAAQIIKSIPGVPYYNNVVDDYDAKDYSWGVTKKVIEYAKYLKQHPESLAKLPPIQVINGQFKDGAHRVSAVWLLQQRMDPKNPLWKNAKLNVQFAQQDMAENFADGRVKGKSRPGRVKRSGASCAGSVTDLRAKARKYGGERGKMYHWCANMKGGKK
jgi:predicted nucleotidyltransferase